MFLVEMVVCLWYICLFFLLTNNFKGQLYIKGKEGDLSGFEKKYVGHHV